jgi:hypothetical protein
MSKDVDWTSELTFRLRQLHDQGLSFSKITRTMNEEFNLNLTPNACIGKARRSDFPMRYKPPKAPKKPKRPPPKPKMITIKPKLPPPPAIPAGTIRVVELDPVATGTLTLYELNGNTCRWAHGADPPYTFCGRPTHEDTPYCLAHHGRVYVLPAKRWR